MTVFGHPIFVLQKRVHKAAIVKGKAIGKVVFEMQIGQGSVPPGKQDI